MSNDNEIVQRNESNDKTIDPLKDVKTKDITEENIDCYKKSTANTAEKDNSNDRIEEMKKTDNENEEKDKQSKIISETKKISSKDIPIALPSWVGLPSFHKERKVYFSMKKKGETIGFVNLQRRPCYVFGRIPKMVDIVAEHPSISRRHCVVVHNKHTGGVYVIDMKSTQRTFVDGKPIKPYTAVLLTPTTPLVIGKSTRSFYLRGAGGGGGRDVPQKNKEDLIMPGKEEEVEENKTNNKDNTPPTPTIPMGELTFKHFVTVTDKQYLSNTRAPPPSNTQQPKKKKRKIVVTADDETEAATVLPTKTLEDVISEAKNTKPDIDIQKYKKMTPKARLAFLKKQQEEKKKKKKKENDSLKQRRRAIHGQGFITGAIKAVPLTNQMRLNAAKAADGGVKEKKNNNIGPAMPPIAFLANIKAKQENENPETDNYEYEIVEEEQLTLAKEEEEEETGEKKEEGRKGE